MPSPSHPVLTCPGVSLAEKAPRQFLPGFVQDVERVVNLGEGVGAQTADTADDGNVLVHAMAVHVPAIAIVT